MQTIPAIEIKRRGIVAIEELLPKGPVHIVKRNQLTCVVLTEKEYQKLLALKQKKTSNLFLELLHKPATGTQTRKQLDKRLTQERSTWDKN